MGHAGFASLWPCLQLQPDISNANSPPINPSLRGFKLALFLSSLWKQDIQSPLVTIVSSPDSPMNERSRPNPPFSMCSRRLHCSQILSVLIRQTAGHVAGGWGVESCCKALSSSDSFTDLCLFIRFVCKCVKLKGANRWWEIL